MMRKIGFCIIVALISAPAYSSMGLLPVKDDLFNSQVYNPDHQPQCIGELLDSQAQRIGFFKDGIYLYLNFNGVGYHSFVNVGYGANNIFLKQMRESYGLDDGYKLVFTRDYPSKFSGSVFIKPLKSKDSRHSDVRVKIVESQGEYQPAVKDQVEFNGLLKENCKAGSKGSVLFMESKLIPTLLNSIFGTR